MRPEEAKSGLKMTDIIRVGRRYRRRSAVARGDGRRPYW